MLCVCSVYRAALRGVQLVRSHWAPCLRWPRGELTTPHPPWNVMANRLKGSKITRWRTDWLPGMQSRTDLGGPHHYLALGPASAKDGPECVYVCVSKCVCMCLAVT